MTDYVSATSCLVPLACRSGRAAAWVGPARTACRTHVATKGQSLQPFFLLVGATGHVGRYRHVQTGLRSDHRRREGANVKPAVTKTASARNLAGGDLHSGRF